MGCGEKGYQGNNRRKKNEVFDKAEEEKSLKLKYVKIEDEREPTM